MYIVRSDRKTISIGLNKTGEVVIRIPYYLKKSDLNQILNSNKKYVEKLTKKGELIKNNKKYFRENEEFFYLGKTYKLKIVENQTEELIFDNAFFLSKNFINKSREIFRKWYANETYSIVMKKVDYYSKKFSLKYSKIKVSNSNVSWGSCNFNKVINFSWRLSMLPEEIIEYVVVHELVHLKELNHSKNFWKLVETMLPNYRTYRNWLKNNNHLFLNLF